MATSAATPNYHLSRLPYYDIDKNCTITTPFEDLIYDLKIVQEPCRSRASNASKLSGRRVVDPPPVILMKLFRKNRDGSKGENVITRAMGTYFLTIEIIPLDEPTTNSTCQPKQKKQKSKPTKRKELETLQMKQNPKHLIFGTTVTSANIIWKGGDPRAYFFFGDISVKTEGTYKFEFSLFEFLPDISNLDVYKYSSTIQKDASQPPHCNARVVKRASLISAKFQAYSAKDFPGLESSPQIIRDIASLGCKVRVRNTEKKKKLQSTSTASSSPINNSNIEHEHEQDDYNLNSKRVKLEPQEQSRSQSVTIMSSKPPDIYRSDSDFSDPNSSSNSTFIDIPQQQPILLNSEDSSSNNFMIHDHSSSPPSQPVTNTWNQQHGSSGTIKTPGNHISNYTNSNSNSSHQYPITTMQQQQQQQQQQHQHQQHQHQQHNNNNNNNNNNNDNNNNNNNNNFTGILNQEQNFLNSQIYQDSNIPRLQPNFNQISEMPQTFQQQQQQLLPNTANSQELCFPSSYSSQATTDSFTTSVMDLDQVELSLINNSNVSNSGRTNSETSNITTITSETGTPIQFDPNLSIYPMNTINNTNDQLDINDLNESILHPSNNNYHHMNNSNNGHVGLNFMPYKNQLQQNIMLSNYEQQQQLLNMNNYSGITNANANGFGLGLGNAGINTNNNEFNSYLRNDGYSSLYGNYDLSHLHI